MIFYTDDNMLVHMQDGSYAVVAGGRVRFYPNFARATNILRTLRVLAGPHPRPRVIGDRVITR